MINEAQELTEKYKGWKWTDIAKIFGRNDINSSTIHYNHQAYIVVLDRLDKCKVIRLLMDGTDF